MSWYKVAEPTEFAQPFLQKVNAGGKSICLVNNDGQLFALAAACPHAGADLSKGWCHERQLVCPFHRYQYDLSTGRGAPGQNDYVRTYAVEVRADGIYVEVSSFLERLKSMFTG